MENAQIADILDEIADLLELRDDNPFRIRSYRHAAQAVRNLSDRLEDLAEADKDLSNIRNIGESTAGKIHEILETGTCKRVEALDPGNGRGGTCVWIGLFGHHRPQHACDHGQWPGRCAGRATC